MREEETDGCESEEGSMCRKEGSMCRKEGGMSADKREVRGGVGHGGVRE